MNARSLVNEKPGIANVVIETIVCRLLEGLNLLLLIPGALSSICFTIAVTVTSNYMPCVMYTAVCIVQAWYVT